MTHFQIGIASNFGTANQRPERHFSASSQILGSRIALIA